MRCGAVEKPQQYIYILALEHHCFYVGRTNNIPSRLQEHRDHRGKGSQWTQMHKVIKLLAVIQCIFREEEDMWTKKLMSHYSIHQVRGGAYSQVKLGFDQIYFLEMQLRNSKNECFTCGKSGHLAYQCYKKPKTLQDRDRLLQDFKKRHLKDIQTFGIRFASQAQRQIKWEAFKANHLNNEPTYNDQYDCQTFSYKEGIQFQRQSLSKQYLDNTKAGEQLSFYINSSNSAFLLALAEALFMRPEVKMVAKRTLLELQRDLIPNQIAQPNPKLTRNNQKRQPNPQQILNGNITQQAQQQQDEAQLLRKMSQGKKKIKRQSQQAISHNNNSKEYNILTPIKNIWNSFANGFKRLF